MNEEGIKTILGAMYMWPALMQDSTNAVTEQFNDIEKALDNILNEN